MKCTSCSGKTRMLNTQRYHYTESGLDNVYLENIEVRVCDSCGDQIPRISRINDLHATIGRALVMKPTLLVGKEIRFLRQHLGMKSREFAALLRVDNSTLSRWEQGDQAVGPQSDGLIRLLYVRLVEEKEGKMLQGNVADAVASSREDRDVTIPLIVNMRDPSAFDYRPY
ncbi:MAG: type II TA system antitoxin MqsA family protein [Blastocatellia bacterium]